MRVSEVRTKEDLLGILNSMIEQRTNEAHNTFALNVIYQGLNVELEGYEFIYDERIDLEKIFLGSFYWETIEEDENK